MRSKKRHTKKLKIIKVGETSYAIILPRSWLRFYKLTDKDEVKVVSDSTIVIEPPPKDSLKPKGG